jgi:pimeloyl-ACP methyl ester carboxylesterase
MAKNNGKPNQTLKIPKIILIAAKLLSFISTKLTVNFAARLFTTPIKYRLPKREVEMDRKSRQESITIPLLQKDVVVYHYGESSRKILLVHGWSGRGTQLVKFADALLAAGYSTVSFDAPAHGKSKGSTTLLPEFIETILELEKQFGPFEAAIGHSLGGIALLNSVRRGLKIEKLTIVGAADIISDITDDFVGKLELDFKYSALLREYFEDKYQISMDSFSAWHSAAVTPIPVLVVHDENDDEVPVKCAYHIHKQLRNGELVITRHLGHRKILGDKKVIAKALDFLKN